MIEPAPTGTVTLAAPTAEHHRTALGIGEAVPRLSWVVDSAPAGWVQRAYEVEVSEEGAAAWSNGRVESPDSVLVPWPAPPLASRAARAVRVRVWGDDARPSAWSPPLELETGLLDPADWTAVMVGPPPAADTDRHRPWLLRRTFHLPSPPLSARLYTTAQGVYECELNGRRVGDEVLAPGWTSYDHRLRYQTHDVTPLLREGANTLGGHLAEGWFRGRLGWEEGVHSVWGDLIGLLAQLEVLCADGTRLRIGTDPQWRAAPSPITESGLYDGERFDARLAQPTWSLPAHDDTDWLPVARVARDPRTLVAPTGPPVRCTEEVSPVQVLTSPSGRTILDFGQNLVGRLSIRLNGPRGTEITLRHAEILEDGELCTRPLRTARATDRYVMAGTEEETWEPRFTVHGFRYAEVSGLPGPLPPDAVVARVLHTDLRRTGWFTCSDPLLERLHENVVWSMRGNFVDVPTDCPQRDERLGWTGDLQIFAPTASFLYDCAGMLTSWLADLSADQYDDGTVPFVVPEVPVPYWTPAWPTAVWGDAAVLVPWTLYQRFGDRELLRRQYAGAKAWVDVALTRRDDSGVWEADPGPRDEEIWRPGRQLGDWLDPATPPDDPFRARTDARLVATAYLAHSLRTLADTAAVLDEDADRDRYAALDREVRAAFVTAWADDTGALTGGTQTGYALALHFGLLPPGMRSGAAERLAELVAAEGHRIATGFAGTPVVCDALSEGGAVDTAYALLLQTQCPSWLYPVLQGATTVWERWDSQLPDGSVNPGGMTSFNHYALGSVADWLHRTVAGLAPAEPGYRRLRIAPRPGGGLTHASARHLTPYGTAEVAWRVAGGQLRVEATVPVGTTALVDLPGCEPVQVGSGRHEFTCALASSASPRLTVADAR